MTALLGLTELNDGAYQKLRAASPTTFLTTTNDRLVEENAGTPSKCESNHPSWHRAAEALGQKKKRFLTPSGQVELTTPELEKRLATAGHAALPSFYTHPEVTGRNPSIEYAQERPECLRAVPIVRSPFRE